jgi:cystathionine gamma-synthase/cystathionine gamma-lyase
MKFSTKAIVVGQEKDPSTGAVIVPIHPSSTFAFDEIGKHRGFEYSRCGNPTRTALENCLASLENGKYGLSFASGLSAEQAVLSILRPGDHVVSPEDIYGGTFRLFDSILKPMGINFTFVDAADLNAVEKAFTPKTKLVWIETPTNPLLKIFDIQSIAHIAHQHGALLVADNTFASPYFQQPLALGADVVVHSTTKYINGHSDVIGGAVVLNDDKLYEQIYFYQNSVGAIASPFDAWLTLRGVRTLAVRMKQHEANAFAVARFLQGHLSVEAVYYPGLETHPNHEIAKKQMSGFGGVVSFKLKGGEAEANVFFKRLKLFVLADSLGGVESLANYSTRMTHEHFPSELKQRIGITDNLIRLSVGIEDIEDIIDDLKNALL